MLLDTTHTNKENDKIINQQVGTPFPILTKLKLNGVGSKRMMVEEVSEDFKNVLNTVSDINYGNIELRPLGVLVRLNKGLKTYTWVIPYYHLSFFKTSNNSIHAQGSFVRFRKNTTFNENRKFFKKMMDLKIQFDKDKRIDDNFQYYVG